jgi:uncharacterized protein (TIGR03032 family)
MLPETNPPSPPPLPQSAYTDEFPGLLEQLGICVFLTTYQANQLVVLRSDGAGGINTHYWSLPKPMGLAADRSRLAVGTSQQIRHYRNMEPLPRRLEPAGRYDACYLPRLAHITGDIDIHEMAWAGDELWFVNTRFSCLCTLDGVASFVPRWRPPFISGLAAEDRCHLNGLGLVSDGKGGKVPRYVTCLAATDTPRGWREHKKAGGVLLEVPGGATVAAGLSMPHSPRLHDGLLWILESGAGGIGLVDPGTGRYECFARLPGFTRGLDFFGRLAFVGLSQVRESAIFSGIAIAERSLAERACGIWVVDVSTGQTVAFLRFEAGVQEIFAVQVVSGVRYPELLHDTDVLADAFDLPLAALADVAKDRAR